MAVKTVLEKRSSERWAGSLGSRTTITWGCTRVNRKNSTDITIIYIYISVNVNWLMVIVDAGLYNILIAQSLLVRIKRQSVDWLIGQNEEDLCEKV